MVQKRDVQGERLRKLLVKEHGLNQQELEAIVRQRENVRQQIELAQKKVAEKAAKEAAEEAVAKVIKTNKK